MTCEHALDDGAYVLGALSPAERADFERHLSTCAACREAVANLAVLPGLLGRLEPARAIAVAGDNPAPMPTAPTTVLPRVLAAAAQQRRYDRRHRRRRRVSAGLAYALATLVLVVGVATAVHMRDSQPVAEVAMSAMRPAQEEWLPVSADVGIVADGNGSKLVMTCWYSDEYPGGTWVVRMVVFSKLSGQTETLGTWTADPGARVTVTGHTHLKPDQISRVEMQRGDNTTLLWWTPS